MMLSGIDDKESEELRRQVLLRARSQQGGEARNNTYFARFCNLVFANRFSQGFTSAECMHFHKLLQIFFHRNSQVSQVFAKLSQALAHFVNVFLQCIAVFHKLSVPMQKFGFATFRNMISDFTSFRKHQPISWICFRSVLQYFTRFQKYGFATFHNISKLSQIQFCSILQCLAMFCNLQFHKVQQSFARFSNLTFARILFCKNHGFARFCNAHFADERNLVF